MIRHISAAVVDVIRAINDLFTPHVLTPEEAREGLPDWKGKTVQPREVPRVESNAKRLPGEANVFVWGDLSTVSDAGTLTPAEWGYVVDAYPSADPKLAGIVKRGIIDGKTHAQIAHEAGQRLDKKVSVSVVSKIAAPLSRLIGEAVSKTDPQEIENW